MYGKETRTFDSHRGFFVRCHTNIELSPRLPLAMTGIINGRYAHNQNSVDRWLQPTNLTVSLNRGCDRSVVSDSYARKTWYSEAIPVPKSASGNLPYLLAFTWLCCRLNLTCGFGRGGDSPEVRLRRYTSLGPCGGAWVFCAPEHLAMMRGAPDKSISPFRFQHHFFPTEWRRKLFRKSPCPWNSSSKINSRAAQRQTSFALPCSS